MSEEAAGGTEAQCARLEALLQELHHSPIAIETRAANEQHYEVPTQFYQLCLGPHLKYSSGLWTPDAATLADAVYAPPM